MLKQVSTESAPAAIGPYSQAIECGGFIFLSGQIPLRPDGTLVTGDIRAQVEQVLANLDAVLTAADTTRLQVVKSTIFLTDLADFAAVNELYGQFFGDHRPARSTVQVAALPRGVNVEIELIVAKG